MSNFLLRAEGVETPLVLKVGVCLQVFWSIVPLLKAADAPTLAWICVAIQAFCLFGAWNMKRWAVVGLLAVVALNVLVVAPMLDAGPGPTSSTVAVTIIGVLWRIALLGPIIGYWRRMSWA